MIKTGVYPPDMSSVEIGEYKRIMHEMHPDAVPYSYFLFSTIFLEYSF